MRSLFVAVLVVAFLPLPLRAQSKDFRLAPGFEITEFADSKLAPDIHCMTIDARGRILVSGRGYLRWLVDDNGDGKADRAIDLTHVPKEGANGLLWENDTLFVVADGGLRRYRLKNDQVTGPSELIKKLKTGGEHHAHAVKRGPDGWLYVMCGNDTGIDKSHANVSTSPIREPIAGCLIRFSPDFKRSEIVADGFRNAYDFDFNLDGEPFTYDSDNERCVSLPWYEGCRFYHVLPGGNYGWRSPQLGQFWRLPPYFADVVAPLDDLGRGSPTGVACYLHTQFPKDYQGGFFLCDWTFGRIFHVALSPKGTTYAAKTTVFLQSQGDNGFAPTAAVVHPKTGDLYVSIGGRGTRGAVYRIRHTERFKQVGEGSMQPMAVRSLEWEPGMEKELKRMLGAVNAMTRRRALEGYRRHFGKISVGGHQDAIKSCWDNEDRTLRYATVALLVAFPEKEINSLAKEKLTLRQKVVLALADRHLYLPEICNVVGDALRDKNSEIEERLDAIRVLQIRIERIGRPTSKTELFEGYGLANSVVGMLGRVSQFTVPFRGAVVQQFPTGDARTDRELARLIAMTRFQEGEGNLSSKLVAKLTSGPIDNLHYLMVLAYVPGLRDAAATRTTTEVLLTLNQQLSKLAMQRDRNWAPRVSEMYAALCEKDKNLRPTLINHPDFGRPDHVLFVRGAPVDLRMNAAQTFLDRAKKDKGFTWNEELVSLIGALPLEQALPVLRPLYGKAGLDAALLPILARQPEAADRAKFVAGLAKPQPAIVKACLDGLEKLPGKPEGGEALNLIRAMGQQPDKGEGKALAKRIGQYLDRSAGQSFGTNLKAWEKWLVANHPTFAVRLTNPDGVDVGALERRFAGIDLNQGQAERGKAVYVKANCAACHSGNQAIGPDLNGVANRFSKADLFTAIVQPSKDVPARYQTTIIETTEGKSYQGVVIYEAVDGTILQTGADATVRMSGLQIAAKRVSTLSLMPAGLLDPLSDAEVADLYAYLRALGKS